MSISKELSSEPKKFEIPIGVNSFGSATVRVAPDVVVLQMSVEFTEKTAKEAFAKTKAASQKVRQYLTTLQDAQVSTSHINLLERTNWQTREFIGYSAIISFCIVLKQLEQTESVVTDLIGLGANKIQSVSFQSSKLKQHRKEARRLAILAAREKAMNYCDAVNADIGDIIHIEDQNPDMVEHSYRGHGHGESNIVELEEDVEAIDHGDISIAGAVKATFEIKPRS